MMNLKPRCVPYVTLGRKIVLDRCPWNSGDLQYNSTICHIPFTGYSLMWYDKRYRSEAGRPIRESFHKEMVEEVLMNTNLYPVWTQYHNSDDPAWTDHPLITDADWDRVPDMVGRITMWTKGYKYAGDIADVWWMYDKYGIREFYTAREEGRCVGVGYAPSTDEWFGWSHRALFRVKKGDVIDFDGIEKDRFGSWGLEFGQTIKTDEEARVYASLLADYVS